MKHSYSQFEATMTKEMSIPSVESHLPELMDLVTLLAQDFDAGEIDSQQAMADRVQAFFVSDMIEKMDSVLPGWREMSSYSDGATLVHVMCVFTGLLLCPEYCDATPAEQTLMKWIVLFHDIGKKAQKGQRDHVHGFRSASMAGETLPRLGFGVTNNYQSLIGEWVYATENAIAQPKSEDYIQDNSKLPKIIDGIDRMFGRNTPTALVVKAVLLHMSINVVEDWPQTAPLFEAEIRQYIDTELFPLLKAMMLADNDAWALFSQHTKERHRRNTLAVFEEVRSIIES